MQTEIGVNLWSIIVPIGLLSLILLVAKSLLELAIKSFWSKKVDTDYVTIVSCQASRDNCRGNADIRAIKQSILLLVKYSENIPDGQKDRIMSGMVD